MRLADSICVLMVVAPVLLDAIADEEVSSGVRSRHLRFGSAATARSQLAPHRVICKA